MAKVTFMAERSRQFDILLVKEATFVSVDGCSERASELSTPGQDKTRQLNYISTRYSDDRPSTAGSRS